MRSTGGSPRLPEHVSEIEQEPDSWLSLTFDSTLALLGGADGHVHWRGV
jgi:hypothetical protein